MEDNQKEFLENNLKYLGFGDSLNKQLGKNLAEGKPEFQLKTSIPHFSGTADYTLDFKMGDNGRLYFITGMEASTQREIEIKHAVIGEIDTRELEQRIKTFPTFPYTDDFEQQAENKYEQELHTFNIHNDLEILAYTSKEGKQVAELLAAKHEGRLKFENEPERWARSTKKIKDNLTFKQHFSIYQGRGITAKEAFNLLQDRAVYRTFKGQHKNKYQNWMKLDFNNKNEKGNYKVLKYNKTHGFQLEKVLDAYPIRELTDAEQRKYLIKSLEKGNQQQVTVERGDLVFRHYVEASPDYKDLVVYDQHLNKIPFEESQKLKIQEVKQELPELSKSQKQDLKNDKLSEEGPKQKRTRKMSVS